MHMHMCSVSCARACAHPGATDRCAPGEGGESPEAVVRRGLEALRALGMSHREKRAVRRQGSEGDMNGHGEASEGDELGTPHALEGGNLVGALDDAYGQDTQPPLAHHPDLVAGPERGDRDAGEWHRHLPHDPRLDETAEQQRRARRSILASIDRLPDT